MDCPYCDIKGHRREVHVHLVEMHGKEIQTGYQDDGSRMFYRVDCPACQVKIERTIKPRLKDRGFLEEYDREIRLVAFDMLLNHIEMLHPAKEKES